VIEAGGPSSPAWATAWSPSSRHFLLGRIAPLARVEADPDELLAVGRRLLERFVGLPFGQVAEEAHDQGRRDAQLPLGLLDRPRESFDDRLERDAPVGVGLRVEEDLRPDDVVGPGLLQVRVGHLEEVLLMEQHRRRGVVDVEKALQVAEGVGPPHRLGVRVGEGDAVSLADREGHLGLESALDVEMELGLGGGGHHRR
jgi:hypothetical protein